MPRKYELKQRAVRQAETRRRVLEAAVELHRTKGPVRTSLSDVARLAGVQRHTLYRYFPDRRALVLSCWAFFCELNPPPGATAWRETHDPEQRVRDGLSALYDYFERCGDMVGSVLRDAETDPLAAELEKLWRTGPMRALREELTEGFKKKHRIAVLDLALDFYAWRRLRDSGLTRDEAVATMVTTVLASCDGGEA
jgi:AcrR family transcriptional regulator